MKNNVKKSSIFIYFLYTGLDNIELSSSCVHPNILVVLVKRDERERESKSKRERSLSPIYIRVSQSSNNLRLRRVTTYVDEIVGGWTDLIYLLLLLLTVCIEIEIHYTIERER